MRDLPKLTYAGHRILNEHQNAPCVIRITADCELVLEDYGTPVLYCKYVPNHEFPRLYEIYPLLDKMTPSTKRHIKWFLDEYFFTDDGADLLQRVNTAAKHDTWFFLNAKVIWCLK